MKPQTLDTGGATAILDTIGNTPLIPLKRVWGGGPDVTVYAKAEWVNPGGSIKDRPALEI